MIGPNITDIPTITREHRHARWVFPAMAVVGLGTLFGSLIALLVTGEPAWLMVMGLGAGLALEGLRTHDEPVSIGRGECP
jgi:hypothetical protein